MSLERFVDIDDRNPQFADQRQHVAASRFAWGKCGSRNARLANRRKSAGHSTPQPHLGLNQKAAKYLHVGTL